MYCQLWRLQFLLFSQKQWHLLPVLLIKSCTFKTAFQWLSFPYLLSMSGWYSHTLLLLLSCSSSQYSFFISIKRLNRKTCSLSSSQDGSFCSFCTSLRWSSKLWALYLAAQQEISHTYKTPCLQSATVNILNISECSCFRCYFFGSY